MEITFVRHAQSIWNAEDRWQGQTDVPLSEAGRSEARQVSMRLVGERFDRVVSSDLSRALDTAQAIVFEREIELSPGLREMHLGAWCGLPHAEVAARFPDELLALQRGDATRIGGDGESLPEFSTRVHQALASIVRSSGPSDRVLVVTHGGVIRAVMYELLGVHGRERPLIGCGNTGITDLTVRDDGSLAVRTYNDQRHLGLFAEKGDRVRTGDEGRALLLADLELAASVPLEPLGPLDGVVLHTTARGRTQLRRYGVSAPAST